MANILPNTITELIEWARDHKDIWDNIDPTTIGLTQLEVDSLASAVDSIDSAQANVVSTRTASKTATSVRNDELETLRQTLRSMILSVEAFASKAANPKSVYNTAAIPFPKTPEELGQPLAPSDATVELTTQGTAVLKWKVPAKDAFKGKTYFAIERQITDSSGEGPWTLIGNSFDRDFVDQNIPGGAQKVTYRIRAWRNGEQSNASNDAKLVFGTPASSPPAIAGAPEAAAGGPEAAAGGEPLANAA